jgi:hypothetical protein
MTLAEILAAPCPTCGGKEKVWRDCWNCEEGYVEDTDWQNEDGITKCHHCNGRGGYHLCAKCAPPELDDDDDFFDA